MKKKSDDMALGTVSDIPLTDGIKPPTQGVKPLTTEDWELWGQAIEDLGKKYKTLTTGQKIQLHGLIKVDLKRKIDDAEAELALLKRTIGEAIESTPQPTGAKRGRKPKTIGEAAKALAGKGTVKPELAKKLVKMLTAEPTDPAALVIQLAAEGVKEPKEDVSATLKLLVAEGKATFSKPRWYKKA